MVDNKFELKIEHCNRIVEYISAHIFSALIYKENNIIQLENTFTNNEAIQQSKRSKDKKKKGNINSVAPVKLNKETTIGQFIGFCNMVLAYFHKAELPGDIKKMFGVKGGSLCDLIGSICLLQSQKLSQLSSHLQTVGSELNNAVIGINQHIKNLNKAKDVEVRAITVLNNEESKEIFLEFKALWGRVDDFFRMLGCVRAWYTEENLSVKDFEIKHYKDYVVPGLKKYVDLKLALKQLNESVGSVNNWVEPLSNIVLQHRKIERNFSVVVNYLKMYESTPSSKELSLINSLVSDLDGALLHLKEDAINLVQVQQLISLLLNELKQYLKDKEIESLNGNDVERIFQPTTMYSFRGKNYLSKRISNYKNLEHEISQLLQAKIEAQKNHVPLAKRFPVQQPAADFSVSNANDSVKPPQHTEDVSMQEVNSGQAKSDVEIEEEYREIEEQVEEAFMQEQDAKLAEETDKIVDQANKLAAETKGHVEEAEKVEAKTKAVAAATKRVTDSLDVNLALNDDLDELVEELKKLKSSSSKSNLESQAGEGSKPGTSVKTPIPDTGENTYEIKYNTPKVSETQVLMQEDPIKIESSGSPDVEVISTPSANPGSAASNDNSASNPAPVQNGVDSIMGGRAPAPTMRNVLSSKVNAFLVLGNLNHDILRAFSESDENIYAQHLQIRKLVNGLIDAANPGHKELLSWNGLHTCYQSWNVLINNYATSPSQEALVAIVQSTQKMLRAINVFLIDARHAPIPTGHYNEKAQAYIADPAGSIEKNKKIAEQTALRISESNNLLSTINLKLEKFNKEDCFRAVYDQKNKIESGAPDVIEKAGNVLKKNFGQYVSLYKIIWQEIENNELIVSELKKTPLALKFNTMVAYLDKLQDVTTPASRDLERLRTLWDTLFGLLKQVGAFSQNQTKPAIYLHEDLLTQTINDKIVGKEQANPVLAFEEEAKFIVLKFYASLVSLMEIRSSGNSSDAQTIDRLYRAGILLEQIIPTALYILKILPEYGFIVPKVLSEKLEVDSNSLAQKAYKHAVKEKHLKQVLLKIGLVFNLLQEFEVNLGGLNEVRFGPGFKDAFGNMLDASGKQQLTAEFEELKRNLVVKSSSEQKPAEFFVNQLFLALKTKDECGLIHISSVLMYNKKFVNEMIFLERNTLLKKLVNEYEQLGQSNTADQIKTVIQQIIQSFQENSDEYANKSWMWLNNKVAEFGEEVVKKIQKILSTKFNVNDELAQSFLVTAFCAANQFYNEAELQALFSSAQIMDHNAPSLTPCALAAVGGSKKVRESLKGLDEKQAEELVGKQIGQYMNNNYGKFQDAIKNISVASDEIRDLVAGMLRSKEFSVEELQKLQGKIASIEISLESLCKDYSFVSWDLKNLITRISTNVAMLGTLDGRKDKRVIIERLVAVGVLVTKLDLEFNSLLPSKENQFHQGDFFVYLSDLQTEGKKRLTPSISGLNFIQYLYVEENHNLKDALEMALQTNPNGNLYRKDEVHKQQLQAKPSVSDAKVKQERNMEEPILNNNGVHQDSSENGHGTSLLEGYSPSDALDFNPENYFLTELNPKMLEKDSPERKQMLSGLFGLVKALNDKINALKPSTTTTTTQPINVVSQNLQDAHQKFIAYKAKRADSLEYINQLIGAFLEYAESLNRCVDRHKQPSQQLISIFKRGGSSELLKCWNETKDGQAFTMLNELSRVLRVAQNPQAVLMRSAGVPLHSKISEVPSLSSFTLEQYNNVVSAFASLNSDLTTASFGIGSVKSKQDGSNNSLARLESFTTLNKNLAHSDGILKIEDDNKKLPVINDLIRQWNTAYSELKQKIREFSDTNELSGFSPTALEAWKTELHWMRTVLTSAASNIIGYIESNKKLAQTIAESKLQNQDIVTEHKGRRVKTSSTTNSTGVRKSRINVSFAEDSARLGRHKTEHSDYLQDTQAIRKRLKIIKDEGNRSIELKSLELRASMLQERGSPKKDAINDNSVLSGVETSKEDDLFKTESINLEMDIKNVERENILASLQEMFGLLNQKLIAYEEATTQKRPSSIKTKVTNLAERLNILAGGKANDNNLSKPESYGKKGVISKEANSFLIELEQELDHLEGNITSLESPWCLEDGQPFSVIQSFENAGGMSEEGRKNVSSAINLRLAQLKEIQVVYLRSSTHKTELAYHLSLAAKIQHDEGTLTGYQNAVKNTVSHTTTNAFTTHVERKSKSATTILEVSRETKEALQMASDAKCSILLSIMRGWEKRKEGVNDFINEAQKMLVNIPSHSLVLKINEIDQLLTSIDAQLYGLGVKVDVSKLPLRQQNLFGQQTVGLMAQREEVLQIEVVDKMLLEMVEELNKVSSNPIQISSLRQEVEECRAALSNFKKEIEDKIRPLNNQAVLFVQQYHACSGLDYYKGVHEAINNFTSINLLSDVDLQSRIAQIQQIKTVLADCSTALTREQTDQERADRAIYTQCCEILTSDKETKQELRDDITAFAQFNTLLQQEIIRLNTLSQQVQNELATRQQVEQRRRREEEQRRRQEEERLAREQKAAKEQQDAIATVQKYHETLNIAAVVEAVDAIEKYKRADGQAISDFTNQMAAKGKVLEQAVVPLENHYRGLDAREQSASVMQTKYAFDAAQVENDSSVEAQPHKQLIKICTEYDENTGELKLKQRIETARATVKTANQLLISSNQPQNNNNNNNLPHAVEVPAPVSGLKQAAMREPADHSVVSKDAKSNDLAYVLGYKMSVIKTTMNTLKLRIAQFQQAEFDARNTKANAKSRGCCRSGKRTAALITTLVAAGCAYGVATGGIGLIPVAIIIGAVAAVSFITGACKDASADKAAAKKATQKLMNDLVQLHRDDISKLIAELVAVCRDVQNLMAQFTCQNDNTYPLLIWECQNLLKDAMNYLGELNSGPEMKSLNITVRGLVPAQPDPQPEDSTVSFAPQQ